MPGQARRAEQPVADVAGHGVRRAAPSRDRPRRRGAPAPASTTPSSAATSSDRDQRHRPSCTGRRQHEQHRDRQRRPARPARRRAPRRRRAARGRRRRRRGRGGRRGARRRDAAGQRRVEELRPVVRRDRGAQRQVDAEAARRPASSARRSTPWSARAMPAAAASAAPSTVRTPSRNGPVPSRQTRTARIAAPPSEARPGPHVRFIRCPICSKVLAIGRCAASQPGTRDGQAGSSAAGVMRAAPAGRRGGR